ncbi:methyl-accepting chemotaxis protein [Candidatus Parabeggiatoa sp. HSG14]|uniref:methyl-accepting chemotaxis protein n=1 Tax=Candidatus Parabeggiatoa sp. HSG14 TaxID=3055593 RepID=UPI0025A7ED39|nr:methyl-accepting chemotaxis protein [Thiotrichales bacterium HSG14]
MLFVTHLKIKYKLAIMLLFPMVGLLYFSFILMIEKSETAQDMGGLAELTQLSITLSGVVHALQLERGASSVFLKNQGQKFSEELSHYHIHTDRAMTALNDFIGKFDTQPYEMKFNRRLGNLLERLTHVKSIREKVTTLNIKHQVLFDFYSKTNKTLLQFITRSTRINKYKENFPLQLAYLNFLNVKEKAGQERALLAAVFSQNSLVSGQFRQFIEIVVAQETYLKHDVMAYLTNEQQDFLKKQLSSGQFIEETTRMRKVIYAAEKANGVLQNKVEPEHWFKMQTGKINLLKEVEDKLSHDLYVKASESQKAAKTDFIEFLILVVVIVSSAFLFFVIVLLDITKRLSKGVIVANQIADGNLNNQIDINCKDEIGQLSHAFGSMQTQLRERMEENKQITDEALRIARALDSATTNILITDNDYNIIYLNETAERLFQKEQERIRQDLPHFDVSRLRGANFDFFHKAPTHQRQLLAQLTSSRHAKVVVAGLTLDHIITPVINNGERLGVVIEFNNRTVEVATEHEINAVIQAASVGNFQQRISLEDKSGFFQTITKSLNQIMDFNQRAIEDIMHIIAALAQGDLTKNIENKYTGAFEQLTTDINTTIKKLTDIMATISQTAEAVNHAAEEIAQHNVSLSQRTEQQAASLEETAASMEQMTGTVQQNADNAHHATQLAVSAKEHAEQGGEVVGATIFAMTEITRSSQKITDIISVINEIAFQTNLLALNAAVEAARAGEQGRGFAVVASEVRNLAQRSAEAAKEIKTLIEDSVAKVEEGTKLANQSGETLNEIVISVKKVSDIIAEIAAASQEQSSGINQVNKAVAQMDEMTQQNAVMVEEAATASGVMKEQAQNLKEQVAFFNIGEQELVKKVDKKTTINHPVTQSSTVENLKHLTVPVYNDSDWEDF